MPGKRTRQYERYTTRGLPVLSVLSTRSIFTTCTRQVFWLVPSVSPSRPLGYAPVVYLNRLLSGTYSYGDSSCFSQDSLLILFLHRRNCEPNARQRYKQGNLHTSFPTKSFPNRKTSPHNHNTRIQKQINLTIWITINNKINKSVYKY